VNEYNGEGQEMTRNDGLSSYVVTYVRSGKHVYHKPEKDMLLLLYMLAVVVVSGKPK
jgi:hypothetical protein